MIGYNLDAGLALLPAALGPGGTSVGITLGTLSADKALQVGVAIASGTPGTITGATAGSTIDGITGITVSGSGTTRTYSGTPTTAGQFFTETLAGATNSPKASAVSVTSVSGLAATTQSAMGIVPTAQFHPNTSPVTMKADSTFTGYITQVSGKTVLTVSSLSLVTSAGIRPGSFISACSAGGANFTPCTVIYIGQGTATNLGNGVTGTYTLDMPFVANIGSSASPVTFTMPAVQIASINDLYGNAHLQASDSSVGAVYNCGPHLMVDDLGVKFLRFYGEGGGSAGNWLRNMTLANVDNRNFGVFMVGKMHNSTSTAPLVDLGTKELANGDSNYGRLLSVFPSGLVGAWNNHPVGAANQNKLLAGHQMCVMGSAAVTDDGIGGAALSGKEYVWLNEQSAARTTGNQNVRVAGKTGFTVGAWAAGGNSNYAGPGSNTFSYFDCYELVMFTTGQFGTSTGNQIKARGDAVAAALMANWGILPITRRVVFGGDSRTQYNGFPYNDYSGAGCPHIPALFCERGKPYTVPADVSVVSIAQGGSGIGRIHEMLYRPANNITLNSPLTPTFMLGGGNDYFAFFADVNENNVWPSVNNVNVRDGRYTTATPGFANDYYWTGAANQPGGYPAYTCSITGAAYNSGSPSLTYTGYTGTMGIGTLLSGTSLLGYTVTGINYTTSTLTAATNWASAAQTAQTVAGTLGGYQFCVQTLLSRGFKVLWMASTDAIRNDSTFYSLVTTNALVDAGAGPGGGNAGKMVMGDLTQVKVGTSFPFEANYSIYSLYHADQVHFTEQGKKLVITGGDNPSAGYAAKLQALLAL